jgi:hypothetical protein
MIRDEIDVERVARKEYYEEYIVPLLKALGKR